MITSTNFHAGHIVPESIGGVTTIQNLKCICSTCNLSMGCKHLEQFKKDHFSNNSDDGSFHEPSTPPVETPFGQFNQQNTNNSITGSNPFLNNYFRESSLF